MTSNPPLNTSNAQRGRGNPRHSPTPEERRRDADNSRRLLLAAALDEFAENGFAGARVQNIATRAGVNKQLINYYFNGKEGLYHGLRELWLRRESEFPGIDAPLPDVVVRYLHDALSEPRWTRLLLWRGLASDTEFESESPTDDAKPRRDLERMHGRKKKGELAPQLDPGAVLVVLMGAIMAPVAVPQRVRAFTGMDPLSPQFEEFFAEQLRRMVRLLAGGPQCDRAEADRDEGAGDRDDAGPHRDGVGRHQAQAPTQA